MVVFLGEHRTFGGADTVVLPSRGGLQNLPYLKEGVISAIFDAMGVAKGPA